MLKIIEELSLSNKYSKWYIELMQKEDSKDDLVHKHHIVPTSIRKDLKTEITNIRILSIREHFIAHLLLSKMFEGKNKQKMAYALLLFNHYEKLKITSRTYKTIIEGISKRKNIMCDPKISQKVSKALTGRSKETHEYIRLAAIKKSKTQKESPIFQESRKRWKEWVWTLSAEERKEMFGYVMSEESRQKLSNDRKGQTADKCLRTFKMQQTKLEKNKHLSEEELKKKFGTTKGRSWYHNDELKKSKLFKPDKVLDNWIKGRKFYEN